MSTIENEKEESVDEYCEGQNVAGCSEAHAGDKYTRDYGSDRFANAKTTVEVSGASIIQLDIVFQVRILKYNLVKHFW